MRSSLEAETLGVLWSSPEPLYVRNVMDRVNEGRETPLAYTTVMTVLLRLTEKGAAARDQQGRRYAYRATSSSPAGMAVRQVLVAHGADAIPHFVQQARSDPALLRLLHATLLSATSNRQHSA